MFGRGDRLDNSFWTGFCVATFLTAHLWKYTYSHVDITAELSSYALMGHWKDSLLTVVTVMYNTRREPENRDFHITNVYLV